jgi:hypothetical protein
MLSIYTLLACLGATFFAAGFFAYAFYFGGRRVRSLTAEIERVQKLLGEKHVEIADARDEILRMCAAVQSMETQLRQRQCEVEGLQQVAARQDQEIASLQKDAEEIRSVMLPGAAALSPAAEGTGMFAKLEAAVEALAPPVRLDAENPGHTASQEKSQEWRNNLDTILDQLDKMGDEIERGA